MITKILNSLIVGMLLLLSACAPAATPTPDAATAAPAEQPAPTATLTPVHLKVGILSYMSNSPFFIAQEEGYFAEQGLEVEFVNFGFSERDMLPALLQGQLDVGLMSMNVGVLGAIAQGTNLKLVADKGFANPDGCAADGWLASKSMLESGSLDDLTGLRDKKVVAFTGNTYEYAHDLLLEKAGLTNEDMEILVVFDAAARNDGLGNGSIDVTSHSEPWITRAEKAGVGELWVPFSDVIPNTSIAGVVYGPSILEMNTDVGVRFMVAYLKAVKQFTSEKSDRNLEIISQYTQLPAEELKEVCWNSFQPDGEIDPDGLRGFVEWAFRKGYIDAPLDIEQIWDPQFIEQANEILNK